MCATTLNREEVEYYSASLVFEGELLSFEQKQYDRLFVRESHTSYEVGIATFRVHDVFRGTAVSDVITVRLVGSGRPGQLGTRFLLYARKDGDIYQAYFGSPCYGFGAELSDPESQRRLKLIRELQKIGNDGAIRVTVENLHALPPQIRDKVRVKLKLDYFTLQSPELVSGNTTTFRQIRPGTKYEMDLVFPKGTDAYSEPVYIDVVNFKQTEVKLAVRQSGFVKGVLVDGGGMPFRDADLFLHSATKGDVVAEARTDAKGYFEFNGLRPDKYRLLMPKANKGDRAGKGFQRWHNYWYPGTYDISEAEVFVLTDGSSVESLKFELPKLHRKSMVTAFIDLPEIPDNAEMQQVDLWVICVKEKGKNKPGFDNEIIERADTDPANMRYPMEILSGQDYYAFGTFEYYLGMERIGFVSDVFLFDDEDKYFELKLERGDWPEWECPNGYSH